MANDDQTPEENAYEKAQADLNSYEKSITIPGHNQPNATDPAVAAEHKRRRDDVVEKGNRAVAAKQQASLERVSRDVSQRGGRR